MKAPVAGVVESGIEIDVSVLQGGEHVAEYLQKLLGGHRLIGDPRLVHGTHAVPVHALFLEEAVALVHDRPQCLQVAPVGVGKLFLIHAGGEQAEHQRESQAEERTAGEAHGGKAAEKRLLTVM